MPGPAPAGIWGPRKNPAKRFLWGEEPQGSARSFHRQVETEGSGLCGDEVAGSRPGRRGTFSCTRDVTFRLFATPGFPPSRTGLRAAVRPSARPRCDPSGLLTTAPRFFESTQRACIGGAPFMCHKRHAPYVPPAESKCLHRFPASLTRRCAGSSDGLRPGADRIGVGSCTQLGAWRGKKLGALAPVSRTNSRAIPRQAAAWVHAAAVTLSAQGRRPPWELPTPSTLRAGKVSVHSN